MEGELSHSKIGSLQSLTVKKSHTLKPSYFQECQKVNYQLRQYGTTSQLLMGLTFSSILDPSTSSKQDSPAKTSVLLAMERAWKESEADYFSRLCGWPKKSSPRSYFLKTSKQSEHEDSEKLGKNWPASGMIVDGILYPLKKWEQIISEKGGSVWPTPRKAMTGNVTPERCLDKFNNLESVVARSIWPTPSASEHKYRLQGTSQASKCLEAMARRGELENYPTPCVRDSGEKPLPPRRKTTKESGKITGGQKPPLLTVIGGALNPTWVEWLMGVPLGWTELNSLGTAWFLFKKKRHSKDYSDLRKEAMNKHPQFKE